MPICLLSEICTQQSALCIHADIHPYFVEQRQFPAVVELIPEDHRSHAEPGELGRSEAAGREEQHAGIGCEVEVGGVSDVAVEVGLAPPDHDAPREAGVRGRHRAREVGAPGANDRR